MMKSLETIFKKEKLYSLNEVQDVLAYCDEQGYYYEFLVDTSVVGLGDILVYISDKTYKFVEVCVNCYQSKYRCENCHQSTYRLQEC